MKSFFLLLVLGAICIMPSQSQGGYVVSDTKMVVGGVDSGSPSSISVYQEVTESWYDSIIYLIGIKNVGETRLSNVTVYDKLPPDMVYIESYDDDSNSELHPTIVRNRDGTTQSLTWYFDKLDTEEVKWIIVSIYRKDATNDEKNVVEARAIALNGSREQFEAPVTNISSINVSYSCEPTPPIKDVNLSTTIPKNKDEIWVENKADIRVRDVFLVATLPKNVTYHPLNDSRRTEKSKPDNTTELNWSLRDFEIDDRKTIELNVSCNDSDTGCISQVEATGKAAFIDYLIRVENTGETRLTDVVLNDTLPERTQYFESLYAKGSEDEGTLPEPTIISNHDGTTERLFWFLGNLETGANKTIELNVSCLDYNCSPKDNVIQASGNTLLVHKMPILITSPPFSLKNESQSAPNGNESDEDKTGNMTVVTAEGPPMPSMDSSGELIEDSARS